MIPTITPPPTLPNKDQAQNQALFDASVDDYMAWLEVNAPELNALIDWIGASRDDVIAAALAGDLPDLTGQALRVPRVTTGETGLEFVDAVIIPEYDGEAGKALTVNSAENGVEYTSRSGSRVLLDTLDLEEFQAAGSLTSATRYDFPLFDPTRFVGYDCEFVSLQVFNSSSILLPQVTTDSGATYAGGHTIRTLFDDGSGGTNSNTAGTGTLQNGASASGVSSQSGYFRIMRPDLPYLTTGEFAIYYSVGADGIGVQSGLYQHNTAVAIDGLGFSNIHQCLQGFIYMYGILA